MVKKVEVSTFSEKLKKAREGAGLTKQKVAQLLNIQIKYLDWLEEGQIEKLPAEVYARGFLRKYAKILSVDPAALIDEYEREIKIIQPAAKKEYRSLPKLRERWFAITPKFLSLVLGVLVLVLAATYLLYQLNILISPPKLTVDEPASDLVTDKTVVIIKGKTEPGARLTINGQETYINKDGNFEQEINLSQGLNLINIEAANRFEKKSSIIKKVLVKN